MLATVHHASELVEREAAILEERARENWLRLIRTGYRAFCSLLADANTFLAPQLRFPCLIGVKYLSSPWDAEPIPP